MTGSANFVQCPNAILRQLKFRYRLESCLGNLPRPGDAVSLPLYDSREEFADMIKRTQRHAQRKRRRHAPKVYDDRRIKTPINDLISRINVSRGAEAPETPNLDFWQARTRSVR